MDLKSKIFLIYGPTSSGKSEFVERIKGIFKGEEFLKELVWQ